MTHEDMCAHSPSRPTYPHTQIRKVKSKTKNTTAVTLPPFIVRASQLAKCYSLLLLEHALYGGLRQ